MDHHNRIRKETKMNNNINNPKMGDVLLWDDNKKNWITSNKITTIEQAVNVLRNKQTIISNDNITVNDDSLNEKIKQQELKINKLSKKIDKILKMLYNNI